MTNVSPFDYFLAMCGLFRQIGHYNASTKSTQGTICVRFFRKIASTSWRVTGFPDHPDRSL
jgi:hypothetical protein